MKQKRTTRSCLLQNGHVNIIAFGISTGISTSERWQSYVRRSCRYWEIIGVHVCICGQGRAGWRVTRYLYFLWFHHNTDLKTMNCCSATAEITALLALLTAVTSLKVWGLVFYIEIEVWNCYVLILCLTEK